MGQLSACMPLLNRSYFRGGEGGHREAATHPTTPRTQPLSTVAYWAPGCPHSKFSFPLPARPPVPPRNVLETPPQPPSHGRNADVFLLREPAFFLLLALCASHLSRSLRIFALTMILTRLATTALAGAGVANAVYSIASTGVPLPFPPPTPSWTDRHAQAI